MMLAYRLMRLIETHSDALAAGLLDGRPRGKVRIRPRSAEAEEQHESGLIALFEKKGDQPILNCAL